MSSEVDYLEVDDQINGQNYVCLSFVSPESLIQNKEAFKTAKFLQSIAHEKEKDFKYFYNLYLDYTYKYNDKLQSDFDKENDTETNIRGVKVRGVYQTEEEARQRAKRLQSKDSSFNVFVGPVGYWLPWDPCPDNVSNEEYMNEQLNDMVKKYKENEVNRDMLYEEEKREKMKESLNNSSQEAPEGSVNEEPQDSVNNLSNTLTDEDPWMKSKMEGQRESEPSPDGSIHSDEDVDVSDTVDSAVDSAVDDVSETVDSAVDDVSEPVDSAADDVSETVDSTSS